MAAVAPQERKTKPIPRWTLKRFVQWLQEKWKIDCCRETVRRNLKQLQAAFPAQKITIVWDGAPYHRAALVKEAASAIDIYLELLPGYSPDFMPVEHLWQWLREDITYHACYEYQKELIDAVADFQHQINTTPLAISAPRLRSSTRRGSGSLRDRLWVKKHLDPEEEKLRFSK